MSLQLLNLPAPPLSGKKALLGGNYTLANLSSLMVGVQTNSGQYVTPERAIRTSAVLACIRILTEDLSALTLNLYRRTPQGAVLATDDPRFRLLHDSPNPWQTSMELREAMILDVLCFGQSFVEKEIGPDGVQALWPLSAGRMVYVNPLDMFIPPPVPLLYRYADPRTGQRIVMSDDLWITRMLAPGGTVEGQSIILLAREAIGLLLAAEEQGARLFSHGMQTDLIIKTAAELDDDGRKQLKQALHDTYAGSKNAFRPLLLENGLDAAKIGLTAQESQYIEARAYQLSDIARVFRIPDVLLGVSNGKTATFASAEQFFLSYVRNTLAPWCQRIEQTLARDLLAPSETDLFFKHDLDSITRADLSARYAAHSVGITAGFLSRNEARQMENLPILPGLDTTLTPLNMTGNPDANPASGNRGNAEAFAHRLATNAVAHEAKLLADGKPRAEVYSKLPTYIAAKTGLSVALCEDYCKRRAAQQGSDAEGIALLCELLLKV